MKEKNNIQALGVFDFSKGTIEVTDPCYDKVVWCRTNIDVLPGKYEGTAHFENGRVKMLQIIHEDYTATIDDCTFVENYNEIGVDSGLCGFFQDKPDFSDEEWHSFCEEYFFNESCGQVPYGFWSSSGYGDGCYTVFEYHNVNDTVVGLTLLYF